MAKTASPVDNGVNVQALLDAREALTSAPEAAQFKWRASCKWVNGTHSSNSVKGFFGLGAEQSHKTEFSFDADHPELFASEDNGITPVEYVLVGLASCLTAGVAAVAQNREIQLKSVSATLEGDMDVSGILGIDSDVRNGFSGIKVTYADRRRCVARGHQGPRGPVTEALGGVRHRHEPDERHRRGQPVASSIGQASPLRTTTTIVIGAGHAGLAMSRCLTSRSIDHVVLERGTVANTWKTERWDSLRLLTPNWQSRLPDYRYEGDDPDGFMTMPELIAFIEGYAAHIAAPVQTETTVTSVTRNDDGFVVHTDQGDWAAPTVVVASGHCNIARHPRSGRRGAGRHHHDHAVAVPHP